MLLEDLKTLSDSASQRKVRIETEHKMLDADILNTTNKIAQLDNSVQYNKKAMLILTEAGKISREQARVHFEKIVTSALQFITQSTDYEFVIDELDRSKASYEFYIKSTVNGVECLQKPEEANGGGFIDIIALAAKYAYLEIFSDPKIMSGTLIFDEPGKMISEDISIKFAEYIKFLGKQYNRQTIMITHNNNISSVADKSLYIQKDNQGISHVKDNIALSDKNIQEIFDNVFSKENDTNG
jgi:DNA repair ATPase RecN